MRGFDDPSLMFELFEVELPNRLDVLAAGFGANNPPEAVLVEPNNPLLPPDWVKQIIIFEFR